MSWPSYRGSRDSDPADGQRGSGRACPLPSDRLRNIRSRPIAGRLGGVGVAQGDVRQVKLAPFRSFVCSDRHGCTVLAGTHQIAVGPVTRGQGQSSREGTQPVEIKDVDISPTEGDDSFPSRPL